MLLRMIRHHKKGSKLSGATWVHFVIVVVVLQPWPVRMRFLTRGEERGWLKKARERWGLVRLGLGSSFYATIGDVPNKYQTVSGSMVRW